MTQNLNEVIRDIRQLGEDLQFKADNWHAVLYNIEKNYDKILDGKWVEEKVFHWGNEDYLVDGKKYFIKKKEKVSLAKWTKDGGWLLLFGVLFGTDDPIMVWKHKDIEHVKL